MEPHKVLSYPNMEEKNRETRASQDAVEIHISGDVIDQGLSGTGEVAQRLRSIIAHEKSSALLREIYEHGLDDLRGEKLSQLVAYLEGT